jgi:hypothetical protein
MFQHWERELQEWSVPKGRLMEHLSISVVPSGLSRFNTLHPTLKRWAMLECPSGTWVFVGFSRIFEVRFPMQILVALGVLADALAVEGIGVFPIPRGMNQRYAH